MTQKTKTQKKQMSVFVQNRTKMKIETFAFCVITFEPITPVNHLKMTV